MTPVWSGYLMFGLVSIPVRLFPAARRKNISFHLLHRPDHIRIKLQPYCPKDHRVVERSELVKGYEYGKGKYLVIEPAELKNIEPHTAKAMEILEFVKAEEVDPAYFEMSYYLLPEESGRHPYVLLSRAVGETGFVAIAKLFMHNREYTVLLRPHKSGFIVHTMYYESEIAELKDFGYSEVKVREAELKMANELVRALVAKFQPEKYHDTFEENVKKLIKAHLEGKRVVRAKKPKALAPRGDLMSAMKESLAQMEGKKKPVASHAPPTRGASRIRAGSNQGMVRNEAA